MARGVAVRVATRATTRLRRRLRNSPSAKSHTLARNLRASIDGEPTRAFNYRSLGSMAAIGHRKGVANILGLPLSGLPAWLLWRAYYLSQMPTLRRKLRIFVEWTWGMFFPNDITHLRFTRSAELDAPPALEPMERAKPARTAEAIPL